MTGFEFVCYAAAIIAVLWLRAEPQVEPTTAIAPQVSEALTSVEDDIRSLGELLSEVDGDLSSLEDLMADTPALVARPVPAIAAAVAAPVAIAVVKVEAPAKPITDMTSQELRKECQRRGIAWRGVREGGKHLTKPQMIAALQ